ncbi:MAG TPA: Crp/Fnr family transcriptional regulator [Methylomirabilota bacterium]|nr:Crp/Fnr family transcriptional regulator [Methylomirabilota bacterium]
MTPPRASVAATVEVLRRVSYFAALPATEVRRLAGQCTARRLGPGETLFEEGEPCRGLLVVAEGRVEIRQISLRGREQVFHTEGPGATLGEGPLFDGGGYIASAVALAPTQVLFLPRAEVLGLCRRRPEVALAMLKTMARRVRHFAGIVGDLAFRPVTERLARYVATAVVGPVEPGASVELILTHAQLAARLGTVRELIARAFSQLEQGGVISRERSRIVIRDPARLAALARGDEDAARGGGVT